MDSSRDIKHRIRDAVSTALNGKVDVEALGDADDMFDAGMTSHETVKVMLALEDEFDVEFPDDRLNRTTFASIDSMASALQMIE